LPPGTKRETKEAGKAKGAIAGWFLSLLFFLLFGFL
jgi:hypothetical protein